MVGWRNSIAVAWKRFPSADSFQPSVGTTARLKPQMPRVFPGKVKLEMDCTATSQHFFKVYIYIYWLQLHLISFVGSLAIDPLCLSD